MGGRRFSAVGLSRRSGSRWSSGGAPFTPASIAGGSLWLDAALGVTTDTGGVAAWACQFGTGNDAAQGTSGVRPDFTASNADLNGQPTVDFIGGTSDSMVIPYDSTLNLTSAGYSVYFAAHFPTLTGKRSLLGMWNVGLEWFCRSDNNAGKPDFFIRNAADSATAAATAGEQLDDAGSHVVRLRWGADDATAGIRIDDGAEVTDAAVGHNTTTEDLQIGGVFGGTSAGSFDVGEIIIYPFELSAAQDADMVGYFAGKFGIT